MRAKPIAIGLGLVLALVAIGLVGRSAVVAAAITSAVAWARGAGALGVLAFVLAYATATVLLVPGSLLTIGAGFAYGLGWGVALVAPTALLSASLAFLVGRSLVRDRITTRFGGGRAFQAIDAAVAQRGAFVVALLRLSPVFPFVVLNYVLSITKVSPRTYVLASAFGMLPGTILYVYVGSLASTAIAATTDAGPGPWRLVLLGAGLLATVVVVMVVARLARRELARAGATASEVT